MKTIGASLLSHFGLTFTTVVACWKLTRTDGVIYFHTGHDTALVIDGNTYDPVNGTILSQFEQQAGLGVDNLEVMFALADAGITKAEIEGNLFDGATIDVFLVNWKDLTMGKALLAQNWLVGNIELRDYMAVAEVRSRAQLLQSGLIELYSPGCRATLGDSRCGVDFGSASPYIVSGSVTGVTDRQIFTDTSRPETTDVFAYGLLTWIGGASAGGLNTGLSMEVQSYNPVTDLVTLFLKMPFQITVGDTYEMRWGCDKSAISCKNKFNNLVNFRGEPFVPGPDVLIDYELGR